MPIQQGTGSARLTAAVGREKLLTPLLPVRVPFRDLVFHCGKHNSGVYSIDVADLDTTENESGPKMSAKSSGSREQPSFLSLSRE